MDKNINFYDDDDNFPLFVKIGKIFIDIKQIRYYYFYKYSGDYKVSIRFKDNANNEFNCDRGEIRSFMYAMNKYNHITMTSDMMDKYIDGLN